jgi:hypothetical protein
MSALAGWDLFVTSEPWKRLTSQQQVFIRVRIATGDTKEAVRVAYPTANAHSQVVMAYQVSQSPRVRAALACWNDPAQRTQEAFDRLGNENQELRTVLSQLVEESTAEYPEINGIVVRVPQYEELAAV